MRDATIGSLKATASAALLGVAALCATAGTASAQPQYDIIDLGLVNSADFASQGFGISSGGVGFGRSAGSGATAFTWTAGGGLMPLDALAGRTFAVANGANSMGQAVGTASTNLNGSSPLPVIWNNGAVTQLGALGTEQFGRANDINDSGTAVGSMGGGVGETAVIWNAGVASAITATTAGGASMRTAFRINNSGVVVGFGTDPSNAARNVGLMYDSVSGVMTEVPALAGQNGTLAFSISENGIIVGSSSFNQSSGTPFIWDSVNGSRAIDLPAGTSQGSARGVNSMGWAVGTASGAFAVPFLNDGSDTYALQSLIDPASGWDLATNTFSSALGISEDGTIVGTGLFNGDIRAYAMVVVPSPGTLALVPLAGLVAARRRR